MYYDAIELETYMSIAAPTEKNTAHTIQVVYDGKTLNIDYSDIKKLYETATLIEGQL